MNTTYIPTIPRIKQTQTQREINAVVGEEKDRDNEILGSCLDMSSEVGDSMREIGLHGPVSPDDSDSDHSNFDFEDTHTTPTKSLSSSSHLEQREDADNSFHCRTGNL